MTDPTPAQALAEALRQAVEELPGYDWGDASDYCVAVHDVLALAPQVLANLDPRSILSEAERQALADGEELAALPLHKDITLVGIERDGKPQWHIRWDGQDGRGPTLAAAARAARERLEAEHG